MKKIIDNKALFLMAFFFVGAITTSCTNWDDHYDMDSVSGTSLWSAINTNDHLKNFASLVKKAGYDETLANSQNYTIWAPVDGSFDFDKINSMDVAQLKKQFVQNHIAHYVYTASGTVDESIFMLNDKVNEFAGSGPYKIGDVDVKTPNYACKNGVLHEVSGMLDFNPNLYESLDNGAYKVDSIASYFHRYSTKTLDLKNSVVGPTVNGQITYLDSVFIENNTLFASHGTAWINREDSSYSMLIPNNHAWIGAYSKIKSYFNYGDFSFKDPITNSNTVTVSVNADYMQDSLTRYSLVKDLFYNNRMYENSVLQHSQTSSEINCDSLVSSLTGNIIYHDDVQNLFGGTTRIKSSNGCGWITDTLKTKPWNSWCKVIKVEGENVANIYGTKKANTPQVVQVAAALQNPNIKGSLSDNAYLQVSGQYSSSSPQVYYNIPGVLSTTYNIYLVVVPANITNTYIAGMKPNSLKVIIGYNEPSYGGASRTKNLGYVVSDTTKIDTLLAGEFSFPMAYDGLSGKQGGATKQCGPYVEIEAQNGAGYENAMRLDCIILVPKELDEYKKSHPNYKYDIR